MEMIIVERVKLEMQFWGQRIKDKNDVVTQSSNTDGL